MGFVEKSPMSFHLHRHHIHHHHQGDGGKKQEFIKDVPKGCMAIKVGQGEEQQRLVVPVIYFNHPLFMQLLKEAEEEYGFDQKEVGVVVEVRMGVVEKGEKEVVGVVEEGWWWRRERDGVVEKKRV